MEYFVKRMIIERDELKERIEKLRAFIDDNEKHYVLTELEDNLLNKQLHFMASYHEVLCTRIGIHATEK